MENTKTSCRIQALRIMRGLPVVLFISILILIIPLKVNAQEKPLELIIGNGNFGYHNGSHNKAEFRFPYGIAHDPSTNSLLITDMYNHRIRKIDLEHFTVTTLAGSSDRLDRFGFPAGGHADGELETAMFNEPRGLAVAPNGAVFVADTGNHMIRMIYEGQVYTVAGTGEPGFKNDMALNAQFWNPTDIAIDSKGNLLVSDTLNHSIRKIDAAGEVTTFAGNPEENSILNEPKGLSIDKEDKLYVTDSANHQIKLIESGDISVIAGQPDTYEEDMYYSLGGFIDGVMQEARFNFPGGITIDTQNNIFVADSWNHAVRIISSEGNVFTMAGTGTAGYQWDQDRIIGFELPTGIVYAEGYVFVTDQKNNRIVTIPYTNQDRDLIPNNMEMNPPISVFLDEVKVDFPTIQPLIEDNSILVPLRHIAESWNSLVSWDTDQRAVIIYRDNTRTEFYEDQGDFTIYENTAMVKLHTLEEKFNFTVEWIDHLDTVVIKTLK